MDNDSGRGSRSDEPPKLGTVRRLHGDDVEEANATATGEWYETERLTGQITGGASGVAPIGQPAPSQNEATVVLDWRHAPATPPASALQRLARQLDYRYSRRGHALASGAEQPRARAGNASELAAGSDAAAPACAVPEHGPAAEHLPAAALSGPAIDLRGDAGPAAKRPKRRPSLARPARRARGRRLPGWAIVSAVALSVAAVCIVAIASEMNGRAAKAHQSLVAARSRPGATPGTASKTAVGARGILERRVPRSRVTHDAGQARGHAHQPARADHAGASRRRAVAHHDRALVISDAPRTVDVAATTTTQRTAPVTAPASAPATGPDQTPAPTSSSTTAHGNARPSAAAASSATDNSLPAPGGPPAP